MRFINKEPVSEATERVLDANEAEIASLKQRLSIIAELCKTGEAKVGILGKTIFQAEIETTSAAIRGCFLTISKLSTP